MVIQMIWCFIGYIMTVAGGYLGFYFTPFLFTLMPVGATLCAGLCWRLTRV